MQTSCLIRLCATWLAALAASSVLAQTADEHRHSAASAAASAPAKPARAAKAASSANEGSAGDTATDMQAMCDRHKDMMSASAHAERQAMKDQKMKGMSAGRKHQDMMDKHCQ